MELLKLNISRIKLHNKESNASSKSTKRSCLGIYQPFIFPYISSFYKTCLVFFIYIVGDSANECFFNVYPR